MFLTAARFCRGRDVIPRRTWCFSVHLPAGMPQISQVSCAEKPRRGGERNDYTRREIPPNKAEKYRPEENLPRENRADRVHSRTNLTERDRSLRSKSFTRLN